MTVVPASEFKQQLFRRVIDADMQVAHIACSWTQLYVGEVYSWMPAET